jgi:hypothetical protein
MCFVLEKTFLSFWPVKCKGYFYLSLCLSVRPLVHLSIYLWLYSPLLDLCHFFSFLILYTVCKTPCTGDQPAARPIPTYRTTQTQNKRRETSLPWGGFKPTIPMFERATTLHALDRTGTVIDAKVLNRTQRLSLYTSSWINSNSILFL